MPRGGVAAGAVIAAMHRARRTQREPTTRDTLHRRRRRGRRDTIARSPSRNIVSSLSAKSGVRYQASPISACDHRRHCDRTSSASRRSQITVQTPRWYVVANDMTVARPALCYQAKARMLAGLRTTQLTRGCDQMP